MAKIQESAENYLETILILKERNGTVRSVDIAAEMGFSKPSVSVAMKNLREQECITMGADGLITLTEKGQKIAEGVYERHTLFTQWLVSLGVDAATAAQDACRIEHVLSKEAFEAIKRHVESEDFPKKSIESRAPARRDNPAGFFAARFPGAQTKKPSPAGEGFYRFSWGITR